MADVKTRHPEYSADRATEWQLMRDAMAGESAVKRRGETYLPIPSGFRSQADAGAAMYAAYKSRAQFPEILAPSVFALLGIAHSKEIKIDLPPSLEWLWEDADGDGLPLEAFHRRITRALLVSGRYGILADAPEGGGQSRLVGYAAEAIINWDRDFFVLDETGFERTGFDWSEVDRQRVLYLDGGRYMQREYINGQALAEYAPVARGGAALAAVPFTVASAVDVSGQIHTPPLIGVARAAKAIYQLSADYRHQLYMTGQETLVAINGDAPAMVGAGVVHQMIGAEGMTPDLKYVSPSCAGIDAHLSAIEDNRTAAIQAGARLLEQSTQAQESGSARQLRFASETATLGSILRASCGLLERALRDLATIEGQSEAEVVVTPPADLLDTTMTAAEAEALMRVWQGGAISYQTLYENLQRGGIASSERDHEAEMSILDEDQIGADGGMPA